MIGTCRRKITGEKGICENCGLEVHGECTNPPHCVNCGESHPASSKRCDKFSFEKEVQALRAKEHLSFKEARQRVSAMFIQPGVTFSSIISKNKSRNDKIPLSSGDTSLHVKSSNSETITKNKYMNVKRRLSGEREDSLSSKIRLGNLFNLLNDEMDLDDSNSTVTHTTNRVSPSVPSCPVAQAGTSSSACALVQAGTSVSVCAVAQAETSISVCAPVRAETSVLGCSSVQPENAVSGSSSELVETPVVGSASFEAGIPSVSVCALAQGEVGSISAPLSQSPSIEPVSDAGQTKSSSQEQAESLISSPSEIEDILPSIENRSSPEKANACKDRAPGAIPKSKVNGTQQQRAQGSSIRRIKVPNKNKKILENNDKSKGSSFGKTKVSSK